MENNNQEIPQSQKPVSQWWLITTDASGGCCCGGEPEITTVAGPFPTEEELIASVTAKFEAEGSCNISEDNWPQLVWVCGGELTVTMLDEEVLQKWEAIDNA